MDEIKSLQHNDVAGLINIWLPNQYQCKNLESIFDLKDYLPENTHFYADDPLREKAILEHLIQEKRMTQKKIAEEYGVGRSTISDYKRRYGIEAQRNGYQEQVPYGCKINRNGILIEDVYEQKVLQLVNQLTN